MLIEEKSLQHWINHFYGYGSWDARIWFVSHEDGGGDLPEEVAEKLDYFSRAHPGAAGPTLCDIRLLYSNTAVRITGPRGATCKNLFDYRFGSHGLLNGVWKNLISFAHAFRNEPMPEPLAYQKNSFALLKEAMIKLYPLPAPHNHAWYYSWLDLPQHDYLKSRELYEAHVYQHRMQDILSGIGRHKPEVVLMYGMKNINFLKKSIQEFFPGAKFSMIEATPRQVPQHHLADLNGTLMLITTQLPSLRHNRIETGFDWEMFGRSAKSGLMQGQ
jgi:hypothetical protein